MTLLPSSTHACPLPAATIAGLAAWAIGLVFAAGGTWCMADDQQPPPTSSTPHGRELIRDPHFQLGFKVYDPAPGKHVVTGKLQYEGCTEEPVWGLAQWHSRFSIAGAEPEKLATGGTRWANAAKAVILAPEGSPDADLVFRVNAREEYGERARQQGEMWPHLLASQGLPDSPTVAEMKALDFRVSYRLRDEQAFKTADYDPRKHAAHYQAFVTVQNLNRESAGYGDFLWLGIPMYDDRSRVPRSFQAPDVGLKKLIFTPPGEVYTTESAHDRQWITIERDLLPLVLEALQTAWDKGFLQDSRDPADYRLGGMNLGWEVPGIFNVELQVRDLSLRVSEEQ